MLPTTVPKEWFRVLYWVEPESDDSKPKSNLEPACYKFCEQVTRAIMTGPSMKFNTDGYPVFRYDIFQLPSDEEGDVFSDADDNEYMDEDETNEVDDDDSYDAVTSKWRLNQVNVIMSSDAFIRQGDDTLAWPATEKGQPPIQVAPLAIIADTIKTIIDTPSYRW